MLNKRTFPTFFGVLLLAATVCSAQIRGYVNGTQSLTSFNPVTGALVNSFPTGGTGLPFAVATNDGTLYLPARYIQSPSRALDIANGRTGALLNFIALGYDPTKVILTSQGGTAFVAAYDNGVSRVIAVNLQMQVISATLTMPVPDNIDDIALSPDDRTLFVSVSCHGSCDSTEGACPLETGICAFDASTLALKSSVTRLDGYLAVSQDSKSLYVTAVDQAFYIVDASTLVPIYKNPIDLPYRAYGPAIVSPVGYYAVVLTQLNPQGSVTAYTLDTSTNRIVSELFANAPLGGAFVGGPGGLAAFATNGASLWMLLICSTAPTCPGFTAPVMLGGVAFPSGQVISTEPLSNDVTDIAFPRLAAQ